MYAQNVGFSILNSRIDRKLNLQANTCTNSYISIDVATQSHQPTLKNTIQSQTSTSVSNIAVCAVRQVLTTTAWTTDGILWKRQTGLTVSLRLDDRGVSLPSIAPFKASQTGSRCVGSRRLAMGLDEGSE